MWGQCSDFPSSVGNKSRCRLAVGNIFTNSQFKLWLAANDPPRIKAQDGAMWRRIVRPPFEHTLPKGKRDPEVKALLRDPFVGGPAILAWAVRGCLAWQAGRLREPDVIMQATTEASKTH